MSLDLPDESPEVGTRKRAAWVLGVIALVGVVIVLIAVLAFGSSGGSPHVAGVPLPTQSVPPLSEESSSAVPTTPAPSTPASSSSSSSAATVTGTTASCPTAAPCVVAGDPGQLGAAVNAYRATHQLPALPTSASPTAQTCALNSGNGPSCPAGYSWEPVSSLDGAAVVAKIVSRPTGATYLLDPRATSFAVGWAYFPGPGGAGGAGGAGGQVQAVLIENA